jgi:hypothetical protein
MKDFNKFLNKEEKKPEKEKVVITEQQQEDPEDHKLTYKESLVMDDEFKKWMAMSDEIQGFEDDGSFKPAGVIHGFSSDQFTDDIQKQSDELKQLILSEQLPVGTPAGNVSTNVQIPIQPSGTSVRPTQVPSNQRPAIDYGKEFGVYRSNRQIMDALASNPVLKPLFDLLNKSK